MFKNRTTRIRWLQFFRSAGTRQGPIIAMGLILTTLLTATASARITTPGQTTFGNQTGPALRPNLQQETPCLTGDPYDLAQLTDFLSQDTPPDPTVLQISADLKVEWIGQGALVDQTAEDGPADNDPFDGTDPEPPEENADYREMIFNVFNTRTQYEFEVTMSETMLRDIHDCRAAAGLTSATEGFDNLEDAERVQEVFMPLLLGQGETNRIQPQHPSGWSNAVDTRIIRAPTTLWPWRTISQFTYGGNDSRCSGTLIGPRHLITAAHCINKQGTNTWYTTTVTPGRDGLNVKPYGTSTISLNPPPGTEAWYFTPAPWRNPNTVNPTQWDWGLIVIPNRLGNQTGWMGYVARPGSQLEAVANLNRGYPLCDFAEKPNAPAGCQIARLYGDVNNCDIGGYAYQGPDNWYRKLAVSCDLSGGHSGSPAYHYFFDANLGKYVPVVSMVVVTEKCQFCSSGENYPNGARRITPGDLGVISWLRETFP